MKVADRQHKLPFMLVACVALLTLFVQDASAQDLSPAPCPDGQLSARKTSEDAAMGGARMNEYALTNTSHRLGTLKGYPRFEVLSASGRVVRRGRAAAGGAGRVGKPCPTYPRVRITAPGHRRGLVLREPIQLCGEVEVSPVNLPSNE